MQSILTSQPERNPVQKPFKKNFTAILQGAIQQAITRGNVLSLPLYIQPSQQEVIVRVKMAVSYFSLFFPQKDPFSYTDLIWSSLDKTGFTPGQSFLRPIALCLPKQFSWSSWQNFSVKNIVKSTFKKKWNNLFEGVDGYLDTSQVGNKSNKLFL